VQRTLAALILILSPVAAIAQIAPGPVPGGRTITRAQFVQRAADMAGQHFDAIDTSHSGVVTRGQIRAWRAAHQGRASAAPQ
jgi:hypothetical protein